MNPEAAAVDRRPDLLVVDDTPANLDLLSRLLAERGYRFRVASNGKRALAAVQAEPPDLILLDITMPGMDGYEVCAALKADPATAGIPVIFLSAIDDAAVKVRAFRSGGADYVTKPFQIEEVAARIEHQLEIRRLHEATARKQEELLVAKAALEEANRKLVDMARTDGLTGIANRRHLDEVLEAECRRSSRNGNALSVLMVDVDHFKRFNDSRGHLEGDLCLRAVAGTIRDSLQRSTDLIGRYGGEEFLVVLPETGLSDAMHLAERLRVRVESATEVTVSVGVAAATPREGSDPSDLVRAADEALYRAKGEGRNCVRGPGRDAALEPLALL